MLPFLIPMLQAAATSFATNAAAKAGQAMFNQPQQSQPVAPQPVASMFQLPMMQKKRQPIGMMPGTGGLPSA